MRPYLLNFLLAALVPACSEKTPPPAAPAPAATAAPATASDPYAVMVDGKGFHPSELTAPAGKQVTLTFTRTTDKTCAKEVVVPAQNIRRELPLDTPVAVAIDMPADGRVAFGCGMDLMLRGALVVQ